MIMCNQNIAKKGKICYMDTTSFLVHVKTDGIYKDIAEDFLNKI